MNRNYFFDFIRLFFPSYCYGCRGPMITFEEMLCSHCLRQMPWKTHRIAENQANRLVTGPPIDHIFSLLDFHKGGMVQRLLHELKYNNHPEIGMRLGRMLGIRMAKKQFQSYYDLILPVPLHPSRKRIRGFNQSTVFAEGIGEMIETKVDDLVCVRRHRTATQTKKDKLNRWINVSNAFEILKPEQIEGRKILLADDVMTTGATITALASTVYKCGPKSIGIATIADVSV